MSIVLSSRAHIRAKTEGQRGTCALIDDMQGQIENLAAQPAAEGRWRYAPKSCAAYCLQKSNRR
jgi:hypothetical protein